MKKVCLQCGKEKSASVFTRASRICRWCVSHPYFIPGLDDGVFEELPYDSPISYENIKKQQKGINPEATERAIQRYYKLNYSFNGTLKPTEYHIDDDGNMQPNRWGPWRVIKPDERHVFEDDGTVRVINKQDDDTILKN